MDTVADERWNETDEAHRHDVCDLPDDDAFIFCPECGALAESFDLIEHKHWCFYGEQRPIYSGSL